MNDNQVIQQLKAFKYVKPDKNWVASAKQGVFSCDEKMVCHPHNSWAFFHKPSFFVGAIAVGAIALFMFFGFTSTPNPNNYANNEFVGLGDSLMVLEANLLKASNNLKQATLNIRNNPMAILEVKQVVNETIEQGEDFIATARKRAKAIEPENQTQVLSVLTNVEQMLEDIKQANEEVEKQAAEREISALKDMVLNTRQQELLDLAEKQFEQGDYQQALMTVIELSQN